MCVYYMTGTSEGSTESGFMEKPGIEPATPGLQGIALIHYTTRILDWSLLYVYIVGGGPFDNACAQARLILRCKNENRMSLL